MIYLYTYYMCVYIYIYTHTHTMAYLSGIKNEILPFARPWMDLGGIMLNEISHTDKDKYHMSSLICGIRKTEQTEYSQIQKTNGYCQRRKGEKYVECIEDTNLLF